MELEAANNGKKEALVVVATVAPLVAFVAVPDVAAFRLATCVVEETTSGAVPVDTVEVSCPDTLKLVPVAAPITGVVRVGLACMTNVDPVPVCEATEVALPTEVIGPVRFALVVTVPAFPLTLPVTFPVRFPTTFPVRAAVIVPAEKLPDPSRFTMAFAVFASVEALARSSAL